MTNLIRLQSIDKLQLLIETVKNYKQTFSILGGGNCYEEK